jgi:hypothetical protein
MIKVANQTNLSGVNYSVSDFQDFILDKPYSRVFSLFHVASYLGKDFEKFLDFSRRALEKSSYSLSGRKLLCFDFYDERGVQKNPPQDNQKKFHVGSESYFRKVKLIEVTEDYLLLSIDILRASDLENVATEIHKLSIFKFDYIKRELEVRGFKVLASLDAISETEYSGETYGNCIIAELL